jgi:hypothetical protein
MGSFGELELMHLGCVYLEVKADSWISSMLALSARLYERHKPGVQFEVSYLCVRKTVSNASLHTN